MSPTGKLDIVCGDGITVVRYFLPESIERLRTILKEIDVPPEGWKEA